MVVNGDVFKTTLLSVVKLLKLGCCVGGGVNSICGTTSAVVVLGLTVETSQ